MFLIDDLIIAPEKAVFFLFESLAKKAREEWLDEAPIRQELQEIYMLLETGKISDKEFEARECLLVERLEQIARFKSEAAGMTEGEVVDVGSNNGIQ